MVAFISASPDPVIFKYSDVVLKHALDVDIGWDTGEAGTRGRVFRSLNGGAETRLPGPDLASGTRTEKIRLDEVLTFVLRRATGGQELARTTVTTKKNALAEQMTDPDLGFIFHLKIAPAVDTVAVSFETIRPAVPYMEVRRHDNGELTDSWLGSDFRRLHQRDMSGFGGYPQDTLFDFRLVAMKDIGGGKISFGPAARNPEIRGTFTTGSRTTTFFFDTIHVRTDGDPGGAGEFTFSFGVGDVASRKQLGPVEFWGEGDIPAGYDREVAKVITINHAPRRMWAQVIGWEDDTSFGDLLGHPGGLGFGRPGMRSSFDVPRSDGYEVDEGAAAWVTVHIDTDDTASGRFRPFQMSTGSFSIAYDVWCRFQVVRRNGKADWPGLTLGKVKPKGRTRASFQSRALVHGRSKRVARVSGWLQVSLNPEGAVLVRSDDPRTQDGYLVDLGGEFQSPVTLLAADDDALFLAGLNPHGEVLVRRVADDPRRGGEWVNLGGAFTGSVAAAASEGSVDLLVADARGRVYHRALSIGGAVDGEDWRRIGRGVQGGLAALAGPKAGLAVVSLGEDGRILHRHRTGKRGWQPPEKDDWQVLATLDRDTAANGSVDLQWAGDNDLIVSVFVDDELAGALLWTNYPEPDPDMAWTPVEQGDDRPVPGGATVAPAHRT